MTELIVTSQLVGALPAAAAGTQVTAVTILSRSRIAPAARETCAKRADVPASSVALDPRGAVGGGIRPTREAKECYRSHRGGRPFASPAADLMNVGQEGARWLRAL